MKIKGKTILKGLLVGVAAGALTAGLASTANAGAIAYSSLLISNFVVLDENRAQFGPEDFNLTIGNFTKAEAELNGIGSIGTNASDVLLQCQDGGSGNCGPIGQNNFAQQPPIQQFSRGDAVLTGAAVLPGGANSSTVAEVQLNTPSSGTSGSNTGTGTQFSFVLDEDQALTFEFDAVGTLHALLEEDDVMAFAGLGWSLSIAELESGAEVFAFAPSCINASRTVVNAGEQNYSCVDSFSATTGLLSFGVEYLLSINHESAANAELADDVDVPEPEAAALLGLGLLGLAAVRRRVRKA